MTTDILTTSPHWTPDQNINSRALERARVVVEDPATETNLARYYGTVSNYAGRTFLDLEPNDPDAVTVAALRSN